VITGSNRGLTITANTATLNGGSNIGALEIRGNADIETATLTANNQVTVVGNLTIESTGVLAMGTYPLTIHGGLSNNGSATSLTGGNLTFTGIDNRNINARGATVRGFKVDIGTGEAILTGDIIVNGAVDIAGGELLAGIQTITVDRGSWTRSGTFDPESGKVIFTGTTATPTVVNSDNTFNAVECRGIVRFANGLTQTISQLTTAAGTTLTAMTTIGTNILPWKLNLNSAVSGALDLDADTIIAYCDSAYYLKLVNGTDARDGSPVGTQTNKRVFTGEHLCGMEVREQPGMMMITGTLVISRIRTMALRLYRYLRSPITHCWIIPITGRRGRRRLR
jgi:hypothetical protein